MTSANSLAALASCMADLCVARPEALDIYIAVLDDRGEARVELPAWFQFLISKFRYQLTGAWRIVISPMIPQGFPSCYYASMRTGRSCYPLDRHAGPVARTWWRPFLGPGVASPETQAPDRESLPATMAESIRGGPHPWRLAGALGASNPPSPFRNCTEALDTARAS